MTRLTDAEVQRLLTASLSINDKLRILVDHVEFTGGMNDAEDFREIVNHLWHRSLGCVEGERAAVKEDCVEALSRQLHHKMEHLDPSEEECWDALSDQRKEFFRQCVGWLLMFPELLWAALLQARV